MYPAHYFSLFPAFPRTNKIFVAMSFADQFKPRYENVIAKAIGSIHHDGAQCEPLIVSARTVSDSILTEILEGIRSSFLVFADITTIGKLGNHAVRNGNVMYEVGIAHSVRLPEEIILFRSDNDNLLFDTSNIRVNHYDPESEPAAATYAIANAIVDAAKEIDLRRQLAVSRALESLDFEAWMLLQRSTTSPIDHPVGRTMGDILGSARIVPAINKLLEMQLLSLHIKPIAAEMLKGESRQAVESFEYQVTAFGRAVVEAGVSRMLPPVVATFMRENPPTSPDDPAFIAKLEELLSRTAASDDAAKG